MFLAFSLPRLLPSSPRLCSLLYSPIPCAQQGSGAAHQFTFTAIAVCSGSAHFAWVAPRASSPANRPAANRRPRIHFLLFVALKFTSRLATFVNSLPATLRPRTHSPALVACESASRRPRPHILLLVGFESPPLKHFAYPPICSALRTRITGSP